MNYLKKMISAIQSGLRTGSLVYLLALLLSIQKSPLSHGNIISVLVMSGLAGLLTLIFEASDRVPFPILRFLHFIGTAGLAAGMMVYNGWGDLVFSWSFGLSFVLIYLFVWLLVYVDSALKTRKINDALAKRRKNKANTL
ncbi:DUF3021 domain-containing protein [Streptococcus panodentis]|uniref:DUF3021 domain-containing protein n=1 Tax=Streptococcus panodentis TaxID=1581472 RepID=A0ABS5AWA2_9STRE|nr:MULTISPECIES: DUF3021 domain-containing protein [Streptococcus]KXT84500.1 hypothetical protein STRDD11_00940 [Streptococcus sp. DD11]MBP2620864.1 DUF3021 domain-containing protein [Streptococcus panodentis]